MSIRSYIGMEISPGRYQVIYCHENGFLTYNGAMLLDYYHTKERVEELIALGDISCLKKWLKPDPSKPHGFDYDKRQEDVTVAYGRDRGKEDTQAKERSLDELQKVEGFVSYVYIYGQDHVWRYYRSGALGDGFMEVGKALESVYQMHGLKRPKEFYGFLSETIVKELIEKQKVEQEPIGENGPALCM